MSSIRVVHGGSEQKAPSARPLNGVGDIAAALQPFRDGVAHGLRSGWASSVPVSSRRSSSRWPVPGGSWKLCLPHSLNQRPREARWFYRVYTLAHVGGAIVVLSGVSLVQLTMNIEVMNAILLPVVLWFLLVLEARALPAEFRMKGLHRYGVWFMAGIIMALGLVMAGRTMFIWV